MRDLVWRLRCAYEFRRRLGSEWSWSRCWEMSATLLEMEMWPRSSPAEAVDEEPSCWSE